MGSRYLTDLDYVLSDAGLTVRIYDDKWKTRSRSSGGYDRPRPATVMVHHTASDTSPQNDADFMCLTSDNRPVANLMLDREGVWWVMAAGATNTNGKGGPIGSVPADSMNTYAIGVEACNDGIGEVWPTIQQDSYTRGVRALCDAYGITEIYGHAEYAPDRKVDPAGPSRFGTINTAGTWDMELFVLEVEEGEPPLTDADLDRIKAVVIECLNMGAVMGSGGDPDFDSAWGETNSKMARSVSELINRTGGPPPEWL